MKDEDNFAAKKYQTTRAMGAIYRAEKMRKPICKDCLQQFYEGPSYSVVGGYVCEKCRDKRAEKEHEG